MMHDTKKGLILRVILKSLPVLARELARVACIKFVSLVWTLCLLQEVSPII